MRKLTSLLLLLLSLALFCTACGTEPEDAVPPADEANTDTAPPEEEDEGEDRVLLILEAPLSGGRTLTLKAVGKQTDEYSCGIREVRVYDGDALIQTVQAQEAITAEWGEGTTEPYYNYTNCWSPEKTMEALDLNFDGNTDFGLFGWICNNTIPYYYWTWDPESEQYRFACILQGAEAHPETGEVTAERKSGDAGTQWITEYYKPDDHGALYLDRWERLVLDFQPDSGYLDYDREGAREVWLPREGEFLRPRPAEWDIETDLVLVSREVPLLEVNANNTFSYFTEIWEFWDGEPQLVERKEYTP